MHKDYFDIDFNNANFLQTTIIKSTNNHSHPLLHSTRNIEIKFLSTTPPRLHKYLSIRTHPKLSRYKQKINSSASRGIFRISSPALTKMETIQLRFLQTGNSIFSWYKKNMLHGLPFITMVKGIQYVLIMILTVVCKVAFRISCNHPRCSNLMIVNSSIYRHDMDVRKYCTFVYPSVLHTRIGVATTSVDTDNEHIDIVLV